MSSEILINVRPNQTRVAYVENGILVDLKLERRMSKTLVGSIFKGKVSRVLPGMQAAFVDIGLDRAAFLYVGDVIAVSDVETANLFDEPDLDPENDDAEEKFLDKKKFSQKSNIQDLLQPGQVILVQVAKDPLGTKGARITTHISLPGRNIVYMPNIMHIGISRKIENEDERERLRAIVENYLNLYGGAIIRTAGEGASETDIKADFIYLNKIWKDIEKNYSKKKKAEILYSEVDVELRALRDMLNEKVEKIIVDDFSVHKKITAFTNLYIPKYKKKIEFYEGNQPLFDTYDLDLEISRSLDRKVWLKSGGYIVIDEAEALVVIDVNTGRYVGKKDLEDTILITNMESVKEIAHQLRIRNCGGIIILDLIDMERETSKEKVLNLLREELKHDRAPTVIISMSDLGLVEMTRKRIRPSLTSTLCEPCSYCEGKGYVKKKITVANDIFRALEREGYVNLIKGTYLVHCHTDVADWIYGEDSESLDFVEAKLKRNIAFKVEADFHIEEFDIQFIKGSPN